MLKRVFYALVCVPFGLFCAGARPALAEVQQTAHDFSFTGILGDDLPLAQFAGKPVLVVNTASECGFTPQYKDLQKLWEKYGERGLVVIAVPSNDFGGQEPGSAEEIKTFCEVNYGIGFHLAAKEVVKGDGAHPFYQFARAKLGALAAPKWNFHKYLIAPDGQVVDWFASTTSPLDDKITSRIESLLP